MLKKETLKIRILKKSDKSLFDYLMYYIIEVFKKIQISMINILYISILSSTYKEFMYKDYLYQRLCFKWKEYEKDSNNIRIRSINGIVYKC